MFIPFLLSDWITDAEVQEKGDNLTGAGRSNQILGITGYGIMYKEVQMYITYCVRYSKQQMLIFIEVIVTLYYKVKLMY